MTAPLPGLLDSREITVELDGPAVVRSGHTLRHGLLVRDLSGRDLQIATNGSVTAAVVDPQTGEVVGGFSGWQTAPLIIFRVAASATERIPLLIGTASYTPRLGYVVPAGEWGIQATLTLGPHPRDSPRRRTPILPSQSPPEPGHPIPARTGNAAWAAPASTSFVLADSSRSASGWALCWSIRPVLLACCALATGGHSG